MGVSSVPTKEKKPGLKRCPGFSRFGGLNIGAMPDDMAGALGGSG